MYRLQVKTHFDAAHYIKDYEGKCSREHGHRWEVEAVIEGRVLDKMNMLVDFSGVKASVESLIDRLDHYQLNEVLKEDNVTAEFLARWIFDHLWSVFDVGDELKLVRVTVWESPDCCVKYYGGTE